MQEAFVASLLAIAGQQDSFDKDIEEIDDEFDNLILWKEMQKQVAILRKEMQAQVAISHKEIGSGSLADGQSFDFLRFTRWDQPVLFLCCFLVGYFVVHTSSVWFIPHP